MKKDDLICIDWVEVGIVAITVILISVLVGVFYVGLS